MKIFKKTQSFLCQLLGYSISDVLLTNPETSEFQPEMWKHFCHEEETIISVKVGQECNWCGAKEKTESVYQGLFYAYPIKKYMRWPEYMEYHYWEDKKSS